MESLAASLLPCPLFRGVSAGELSAMWNCLQARSAHYEKGCMIWEEGRAVREVGVVRSGAVHILRDDFWGNRSIQGQAGPGDLFGEAYACGEEPLGVSVQAVEESEIVFVDVERILTVCPSSCPFHARLIHNLVGVLAQKNRLLSSKIDQVSQRTTRSKVLAYLSWQAQRAGTARFAIPFDRQGLADYLAVDRSALSAELGKMRREGILDFHKNLFELKEEP